MSTYSAFPVYPAIAGTMSNTLYTPNAAVGGTIRITLTGTTFSVRIQINNEQVSTGQPHLFLPSEAGWETKAAVVQAGTPTDILAPARWVRLIVDSGSVAGGTVEEMDIRASTTVDLTARAGVTGTQSAIGNTNLAALATKTQADGPQFVGDNRWLWNASGTTNGGTVVAGSSGVWSREYVGPVYAAWFGCSPSNPDNTAAIQAALNAAPIRGEVRLPAGTLVHLTQINNSLTQATIRGEGQQSTILQCPAELNDYAVVLYGQIAPGNGETMTAARDMTFQGPGNYALGSTMTTTSGIKINNAMRLENVRIWRYRYGCSPNTNDGHISWEGCNITNNYIGIYFLINGYDNFAFDSYIDGNTLAGIGSAWNSSVSVFLLRVHIGHQPFGILQDIEPGGAQRATAFLLDLRVIEGRFEQIGNAAIYSPNQGATCSNWDIDGEGFAQSPALGQPGSYTVPAGTAGYLPGPDYVVNVGFLNGESRRKASPYPFVGGALGGVKIGTLNGGFSYEVGQGELPLSQRIIIGTYAGILRFVGTRFVGNWSMPIGTTSVKVSTGINFSAGQVRVLLGSNGDPNGSYTSGFANETTGEAYFMVTRPTSTVAVQGWWAVV